ncbi:MAG: YihY/virulence factor BrkB family protein [Actinobacteria bacterium]|nr:YihY/virulence factor BrkB family protein [Actinomycetota bacterium]
MVPLLSAGVAFYGFLALVPALVAIVSIYGLVASPAELTRQIRSATSAFPKDARDLMVTQMQSISRSSKGGLGVGVVVGILGALWSASSGMKHLIEAINVAYDESETRKFVKLRGLAVLLTVAAAVFVVVAFALVALAPSLFDAIGLSGAGRVVAAILRFAVLAGGFLVGLAVLYRYAPDRDNPKWSWSSPGAIVATVLWLIGSLLFSLYTSRFGKYNETYGSLGAIVVLLLWLMLTALCVLVGAEMNSELEAQTKVDTTEGSGEPMGERGADAADRLGPVPAGRGGR